MTSRVAPSEAKAVEATPGPSPGGLVGNVNEGRLNMLDQLHDKAMQSYGGQEPEIEKVEIEPVVERELVNQPRTPGGQFASKTPDDADAGDEQPTEAPQPASGPDLPAQITRKVNGIEVTKSLEEWIAAGQKVEAADRYLAESARAFRETKPAEPAKAEAPSVEEDDAALARAIQTGTEDEAKAAIAKLREKLSATSAIKPEQLLPVLQPAIKQQIELIDAFRTFQSEFKDVMGDPNLRQLVEAEDAKLLRSGFNGSNLDRFRAAGDAIRKWRDSFAGQAISEKQQRKASVTVIPTAAARAAGKTEDPDESPADVVSRMAKARGQAVRS